METVIHKAEDRGAADFGWLRSFHSFSFGQYYNPEMMGFGVLRVINDDHVDSGHGFPEHPHKNYEIFSIVMKGALAHKDSTGNEEVINAGDIQLMTTGSGVTHSEYNHSDTDAVEFFQIWIKPKKEDVKPRYQQMNYKRLLEEKNVLHQLITPEGKDDTLQINQDAYVLMGDFDVRKSVRYELHDASNGLYVYVIDGEIEVDGKKVLRRDAVGITETDNVEFIVQKNTRLLVFEVPMEISED